jgi:NitT/TauT family transport system ATP-binding protein
VGGDAHLIKRAISDRLLLSMGGELVPYPISCSSIAKRQTSRGSARPNGFTPKWFVGISRDSIRTMPGRPPVFRPDVYRSALTGSAEPLPGASSKVEGSLAGTTVVGTQGAMTLESNRFFDGGVFDPASEGYADLP